MNKLWNLQVLTTKFRLESRIFFVWDGIRVVFLEVRSRRVSIIGMMDCFGFCPICRGGGKFRYGD